MSRDLGGMERAADANDPQTIFLCCHLRGVFNEIAAIGQHAPHQRRLLMDRVVEVKWMLRPRFAHGLLFRSGGGDYTASSARDILLEQEQSMARFISLHTLACLTRQGAEELTARLHNGTDVQARRVLVNLYEGKMLAEFEAGNREAVETWLRKQGIHFDWLMRVELESGNGSLKPV
ncbi:MAG TPA: hypothetical protein VNF02_00915 [Candidatus Limnocylindrales bacterium]|nr:hypothetical protein [Candidatus Limnocylindrales bacterium]